MIHAVSSANGCGVFFIHWYPTLCRCTCSRLHYFSWASFNNTVQNFLQYRGYLGNLCRKTKKTDDEEEEHHDEVRERSPRNCSLQGWWESEMSITLRYLNNGTKQTWSSFPRRNFRNGYWAQRWIKREAKSILRRRKYFRSTFYIFLILLSGFRESKEWRIG